MRLSDRLKTLVALPTDRGIDQFLTALEANKPSVVFCTPSHQVPTGRVIQLEVPHSSHDISHEKTA